MSRVQTQIPSRRWWAIYTRSHQEKSLARQLLWTEIPFYLLPIAKTNLIVGEKLRRRSPLFGTTSPKMESGLTQLQTPQGLGPSQFQFGC
jgi:hypothetical protein